MRIKYQNTQIKEEWKYQEEGETEKFVAERS